ncbi:Protein phosphatase 1 regulatory subunit 21 [Armadillidium vulgare]|nr:Protein phosphatase 1 regulatory subunit 21 [Armadillidium vulgare]
MDSPDLQFKYQKLAFEYSKLRAQNQVLKRGVKDEQEKALQLKEDINSRDQSLRKAEQELDSLSFRNQQLTKRLSLLQEDVEIIKSKIQENARLHAELRDLETFYKNKISELEDKIEEVSRNATKRPESIYSKDQPVKSQVNDSVIESLDGKPSRKIMLVDLVEPVKELSLGFIGLLTSYLPLLKKLSPSSAPYLKVNEELSQENSAWKEFSNIFEEVISANSKWDAASFSNLSGLSSLYGSVIKCSTSVQKINSLSEKCFCLRDIQMEAAWKKSLSSLTFCFTSVIPYVSVLSTFKLLNVWSLLTIEEKHESIKNSLIKIHKAFCKINSFLETISLKDSSPDSISLSSTMAQSPGTPHPPYSTGATNAAYVDNSFVFGCLQENLNSSSTENSLVQQLSQATRRLAKLERRERTLEIRMSTT